MKNIRIWKMTLLYIFTGGIYSVVWFARRRNELAKTTKSKLLSNLWLYVSMLGTILIGAAAVVLFLNVDKIGMTSVLIWTMILALIFLCLSGLFLWWLWYFLNAALKITGPRVNLGWLIAHVLITGFSYMFVLQYYFNHKAKASQKKPSNKFIGWSIAVFAVYLIGSFSYGLAVGLSSIEDTVVNETPELLELSKQTNLLDKKYQGCLKELNETYEYVTTENEVEYTKAYDACEAIRLEQNKAVEDYDRVYKELQQKSAQ